MPWSAIDNILADKRFRIVLALASLLAALLLFNILRDSSELLTHKQANALYQAGKIRKLVLDGDYIRIVTPEKSYKIYKDAINKKAFFSKYPVEVATRPINWWDLVSLLLLGAAVFYLIRYLNAAKQAQRLRNESTVTLAQEQSGRILPMHSNVTFKDVAGIEEVKVELEEIIDFLKHPQKYSALDIRLPKGVLLVGPPGVGKTLVAKAVAGEAGVPFFYHSGAAFVHIYVGMGAKRVAELFAQAKRHAPSIVFIDEIDAVGKSRGELRNEEREATLNQLLTEMDGFEENNGVIVIAATNKIEMLDEALLRAGRFDRRIHLSLPDMEDRKKILALYLARKPHDVDIDAIARFTVGFSAAALDTLTNEAALHALRAGKEKIETEDFEAVREKVLLGKHKILSFTDEERKILAYYQSGKALAATWFDIEFEKIGIVTTQMLFGEREILSKTALLNRIKVYLAGTVVTQMRFSERFTASGSDIKEAKALAHEMIYTFAMSEGYVPSEGEVEGLLKEAEGELHTLFKTLDGALDRVAEYLLSYENISQERCRDILRELF